VRYSDVPRLPAAAAHVFVDDLDSPRLSDADVHHLGRVLRLRAGEAVTAADGRGGWRACTFAGERALSPAGETARVEPPAPIVVAVALTKGDKPELAVQKLTELGVDRVVPLAAARCVVRWDDDKAERNLKRLREVARAAAMQSRRVFIPTIDPVTTVADLAASLPALALAHPDGAPLGDPATPVAIGPEGGWTDEELAAVPRHVDLGPTTLRAETAAVAAGVLLTSLRDCRIRAAE
jgi:16S rRNA (uracil1498-N3)-methyltransferase